MHGLAFSAMGTWHLTWGNVLLGGLVLAVFAWMGGFVFGWCWERVSGKQNMLQNKEGAKSM